MQKLKELKAKLDRICEDTNTSKKGIRCLVDYYIISLGWTEEQAVQYAITLFENGTIDTIKVIGKDNKNI